MLREEERNYLHCLRLQCSKHFCFFLFYQSFKTKTSYTKRECQGLLCLHVPLRSGETTDEKHLYKYLSFSLLQMQVFWHHESQKRSNTSSTGSKEYHLWQVAFKPPPSPLQKAQLSRTPYLKVRFILTDFWNLSIPLSIPSRVTKGVGTYQVTVSFLTL